MSTLRANSSMTSQSEDDEYQYQSDGGNAMDDDDDRYSYEEEDDEYQYSDDNDSASDATPSPLAASSALKTRSPRSYDTTAATRAASGAAAKKKRVSAASSDARHGKQPSEYRVIDEEELFHEQRALVHEIAQVLEITPAVAAVLLRHFAWNKEKLYEGYYADPVQAQADAGVAHAAAAAPVVPDGVLVGLVCVCGGGSRTGTDTCVGCLFVWAGGLYDLLRLVRCE